MVDRKKLGNFLRSHRNKVGLPQAAVSDALGYQSPQFVSNWERGISAPPIEALVALVKLYKISKKEFVETMLKLEKEALLKALRNSKK